MPKVDVYDRDGTAVDEVELAEAVFAQPLNEPLIHQAVRHQLANRRRGTASTKTRAEVRGGGRKPWRQKGTGRARAGSIRSPIWTGGGVTFGPKPRDFGFKLTKKARRQALRSALSARVAAGELRIVADISLEEPKTKEMVKLLKALDLPQKILLVLPAADETIWLSVRNIPGVRLIRAQDLNVYDVLDNEMVVMAKGALPVIEEVWG